MKTCSKCQNKIPNSSNGYCKDCNKIYQKEWYKTHKETECKKSKENYASNRERIIKKQIEYYKENKTHILKNQKKYLQNPSVREKRRKTINKWMKEKLKTDPNFRIRRTISARIWHALKGIGKIYKTEKLLGCTLEEAKNHLQSQFSENMNWGNYGKWHIDHIIPCDKFNLSLPEEQKKCFHYTNLQPLWASHNRMKSNKII